MLTLYKPHGLTDASFFRVYMQMLTDGDFEHRMAPGQEILSGFFMGLQEPTFVLYADAVVTPTDTPWCVSWLGVQGQAMGFALWVTPTMRHTKRVVAAVFEALEFALERQRVVVVTTINPRLLRLYRRFGFVECGTMPDISWPDTTSHIWYLTRPAFAAAVARYAQIVTPPVRVMAS